jgi:hypothetical protein
MTFTNWCQFQSDHHMTNLDFDAVLNADSILVLRGTGTYCNVGSKDVRFDSGYQKLAC